VLTTSEAKPGQLAPLPGQRQSRVLGYWQGPRPQELDCESPLHVAVSVDGKPYESELWRCSNHRESKCRPCATRYRRRVKNVAAEGMYRVSGFFYLLTLTAPGTAGHRLPSGKRCACTPDEGVDLAAWNPTAAKRWNRFLVDLERRYLVRPKYFRAAEVQVRGALHYHVIVWTPRKFSVQTLRQLAIRSGFGHEVDLQPLEPGSRKAAGYVSKYVTKSADRRELVPWAAEVVDPETGELSVEQVRATFRTWSQSKRWGSTMAEIRDVARRRWVEAERARQQPPGTDGQVLNDPTACETPPPAPS
jgi:hypothetical protein